MINVLNYSTNTILYSNPIHIFMWSRTHEGYIYWSDIEEKVTTHVGTLDLKINGIDCKLILQQEFSQDYPELFL